MSSMKSSLSPRLRLAVAVTTALAACAALLPLVPVSAQSNPHADSTVGLHYSTPVKAGGPHCGKKTIKNCSNSQALVQLTDGVPGYKKGHPREEVLVTIYSLGQPFVVDSLLRADKRGVKVGLLTMNPNKSAKTPKGDLGRLVRGLNASDHSWAKVCRASCRASGDAGNVHSKLATFSHTQGKANVVYVASGNSVWSASDKAWNEYQIFASKKFYTSSRGYILSSRPDRTMGNYPSVTDGTTTFNFFPQTTLDPVRTELANARGMKGCRVSVEMYMLTSPVDYYIDELIALRTQQHCDVQVILNVHEWPKSAPKKMAKAGITVYDAQRGASSHKSNQLYSHLKQWTFHVKGRNGKVRDVFYTGSLNATRPSLRSSMDVQVVMASPAAVRQSFAHSDSMLRYTKRIKA